MIPRTVNVFELLVLLICLLTVVCTSLSDAADVVGLSGTVLDERLNIDEDSEFAMEIVNINEHWLETTHIEMKKGLVELIDENEDRSSHELTMSRKESSRGSTDLDTGSSEALPPRDIQISVGSTDIDSRGSLSLSVGSTDIDSRGSFSLSVGSTDIDSRGGSRDIDSRGGSTDIDSRGGFSLSVGSTDIEISLASTDINTSASPGDIGSSEGLREIDMSVAPAVIDTSIVVSRDIENSVAQKDIHASPRDIDITVAPTDIVHNVAPTEEMIDPKPLSINDRNGFVQSLIRATIASIAALFRRLMFALRRLLSWLT